MKIIPISGHIGWDVWPEDIRRQIEAANGEEIEFQISSGGGFIDDGLEIFNLIHDYTGKTTARIIGMAASMASYIPLAADKVIAKSNSVFMIHGALVGIYGNEEDHREAADVLAGLTNLISDIYVKKTGKSQEEISTLLKKDSYFFGKEMLEAGFVDEIEEIEINSTAEDRTKLIQAAKADVLLCVEKVMSKPKSITKVAALLPEAGPGAHQAGTLKPAATGANKNKPEVKMNLDELLATDEDAKKEYQARLEAAKTEAAEPDVSDKATDTKPDEKQNDMTRVLNVIESDTYPKAVRDVAIKVLKNEVTIETFESALVMYDMLKESKKSDEAADEQPADTPAGKGVELSTDGKVETEADEKALIAKLAGGK